jgi:hypothetical protein
MARSTHRLELDIDFKIRAIPTDELAFQSCRETAFGRENLEEIRPRHPWLDCLHSFQGFSDPSNMILGKLPMA